jgi:Tol biopolymer transport system component
MKRLATVVVLALVLGSTLSSAQDSERLFKAAMNTELVDGDLKAAIEQYRILAERPDRTIAAKALIRMAECYQKLGNAESQKIYERLVREFTDQPEAATARTRLRATGPDTVAGVILKALPRSDGLPGTVSPDGRYMSFTNWDDGKLYVRDLRAGTDRALTRTNDFNIGLSAISPDATLVAFQSYGGGCDGKRIRGALCVVSSVGNTPPKTIVESEEIREIAPMAWSPDGRTIAVSLRREDRTAQVGLVTVADGSVRVLQTVDWRGPNRIFFSPDGGDLVFDLPSSDNNEDRFITMVAVDGSRAVTPVEHSSRNIAMGFTPDGPHLLFASDRGGTMGLWEQPLDARRSQGTPRLIRSDLGGFWSLGVTKEGALYYGIRKHDRDVSVTMMDLWGGKQLTSPGRLIRRFVGTNAMPVWSNDGEYLAYVSHRSFDPTNNTGRIVGIRNMTTAEEREIRPELLYFGAISWSPNRETLLTSGTDLKGRPGIFAIDARTGETSLIVASPQGGHPQWSLDGKRVFYRHRENEESRSLKIVERHLSSGAERTIAYGEFGNFSVSPDGRFIAATLGPLAASAADRLVQVNVESGEIRDLLRRGPSERFAPYVAPQWTPDGRAVVVRKRAPNELWLVPTTGEPARRLEIDVRDWSFGPIGQFSIHPDGRRLAFLSGTITNEVMVLENFLPSSGAKR